MYPHSPPAHNHHHTLHICRSNLTLPSIKILSQCLFHPLSMPSHTLLKGNHPIILIILILILISFNHPFHLIISCPVSISDHKHKQTSNIYHEYIFCLQWGMDNGRGDCDHHRRQLLWWTPGFLQPLCICLCLFRHWYVLGSQAAGVANKQAFHDFPLFSWRFVPQVVFGTMLVWSELITSHAIRWWWDYRVLDGCSIVSYK